MKKLISLLLVLIMVAMMAACAPSNNETTDPTDASNEATDATEVTDATDATEETTDETEGEQTPADTSTLAGIVDAIYAVNPIEFNVGTIPVDTTDTSEDGLWALKNYTGLDNADMITEAVASEAMIGSIPYSLVLVRVADPANAEAVAEAMASNIDQRKWVCVNADDLLTAYSGDVVMLVMIGSENGAAQPFVDAFNQVMSN